MAKKAVKKHTSRHVSKRISRRKSSKIHWKLWFFSSLIFIFIGTILGLSAYFLINHFLYPDSSLTGAEILERSQNKIPSDVLAKLHQKKHVLGVNTRKIIKPNELTVPILMYHYVEYVADKNDKLRIALNTTPYTLEQEILTLQHSGYTFMTNSELTDALDGKTILPYKPILLTFDDGYRDFATDAYPILKKYNIKATQYVIAGFLNFSNHLTTYQLQDIAKDGLVEIGAHTVHHLWLKGIARNTVVYEVNQSKKILEGLINKPVVSFAYPFGAFDEQSLEVVQKAGFTSATSTIPGVNQLQTNRYFLYRLRPGGRIGSSLLYCLDHIKSCYGI